MKLKTDNQNFNKKIIMKKLVLVVAMFMFACGSFFTITVAASGAFAQFAE